MATSRSLEELKKQYEANLEKRSFFRRENEVVRKGKLKILNMLIGFDSSPKALSPREQIDTKLKLLNQIRFGSSAHTAADLQAFVQIPPTLPVHDLQFKQAHWLIKLIGKILAIFNQNPFEHFDDLIKEAKKILEKERASEKKVYTKEEIEKSDALNSPKIMEGNPDPDSVIQDLQRISVTLKGMETQGKSKKEIEDAIEQFSAGNPAIKKFISEMPGQKLSAIMEHETLAKIFLSKGLSPTRKKIKQLEFSREGNSFIFKGRYDVIGVTDLNTGQSSELTTPDSSGELHLSPMKERSDGSQEFSENSIPLISAELEIELSVEKNTQGEEIVVPHVRHFAVTIFAEELKTNPLLAPAPFKPTDFTNGVEKKSGDEPEPNTPDPR